MMEENVYCDVCGHRIKKVDGAWRHCLEGVLACDKHGPIEPPIVRIPILYLFYTKDKKQIKHGMTIAETHQAPTIFGDKLEAEMNSRALEQFDNGELALSDELEDKDLVIGRQIVSIPYDKEITIVN